MRKISLGMVFLAISFLFVVGNGYCADQADDPRAGYYLFEHGLNKGGYCGDGVCQINKNEIEDCHADCQSSAVYCGNNLCESPENHLSCNEDCHFCGDGVCDLSEESSDCWQDCQHVLSEESTQISGSEDSDSKRKSLK